MSLVRPGLIRPTGQIRPNVLYKRERAKLIPTQYSSLKSASVPVSHEHEAGSVRLGTLPGLLLSIGGGALISDILYHLPEYGLSWRVQGNLDGEMDSFVYNYLLPMTIGGVIGSATLLVSKAISKREYLAVHDVAFDSDGKSPRQSVISTDMEASPFGETVSISPSLIEAEIPDLSTLPRIGGYYIKTELGRGGFGEVYEAYEEAKIERKVEPRRVALKVLQKELVDQLDRFIKEINALKDLSHPNIVTYYSAGSEGDRYYFATEYITGNTLTQIIRGQSGRPLPVEVVLKYSLGIAEALGFAYSQKEVMHRDIKPDNIMIRSEEGLSDEQRVKVIDFGLVKKMGSRGVTETGKVIGTFRYLSPERIKGEEEDFRSDMYSLGLVMYAMLTGRQPYYEIGGDNPQAVKDLITAQEKNYPIGMDNYKQFKKLNGQVSKKLWGLVRKLIEKEKTERFIDYQTLIAALKKEAKS